MIKKLLMTTAMLAAVTAHADCGSSFEGAYVAAGAGINQTGGNFVYANPEYNLAGKVSLTQIILSALGGYTFDIGNSMLAGAEIAFEYNLPLTGKTFFDGSSPVKSSSTFLGKVETPYSGVISARFGYEMSKDTALFLNLGVGMTRVETKSEYLSETAPSNLKVPVTTKKFVMTIQPGVSLEHNINKDMFVRLDVAYVVPTKKVSWSHQVEAGGNAFITLGAGDNREFKNYVKLNALKTKISVGYRF